VPILAGSTPKIIEFKGLMNTRQWAFISEEGLTDQWWYMIFNRTEELLSIMPLFSGPYFSSPLVLRWAVKQGFQAPAASNSGQCPGDIASSICKSKDSFCRQENEGFTCHCNIGYQGNPYIADRCKGHYYPLLILLCTPYAHSLFLFHYVCRRNIYVSRCLHCSLHWGISIILLLIVHSGLG
jgi:hypothetical protein